MRLCNIENDKTKENRILLKLHNNHHCPYCNSNKIKKNYGIRTNTIFFHTRKSIQLWQEYIELFSQGLALRKIVEKMDNKINLKTAFYWRHKILKVLTKKDDNDKLGGTIEADEAFFEESQKGSRNVKGERCKKKRI